MELEIRKLEKAVCDLTTAVRALNASINSQPSNGNHRSNTKPLRIPDSHSQTETKAVCTDTNCGVINSDTTTCDHTLARYRSEYIWG